MDPAASDSENASNTSLKVLLLVLIPGALIVALSLDSSSISEVVENTQFLTEVVMTAGLLMSIHFIQAILYFVPTPIECFSKFLLHKVYSLTLVVAWSCSFVYRLIVLVACNHDGDGASSGDIVGRLKRFLELWLVEFEAELRRGNYSNPAVVAAQSVHLLPQSPPPPPSHQE